LRPVSGRRPSTAERNTTMLDIILFRMLRENPKKALILIGCLVGFFALIGGFSTYYENKEKALAQGGGHTTKVPAFKGSVEPYLNTPAKRAPKDAARTLKGKILTVDYYGKSVDHLYEELPDDLRAASSEEVGTVVWFFWGTEKVTEEKGKPGYLATVCEVVVIDVADSEIIAQRKFRGERPSQAALAGPKPTQEVVAFLEQLRGPAAAETSP